VDDKKANTPKVEQSNIKSVFLKQTDTKQTPESNK
jgi:hypothetical protein